MKTLKKLHLKPEQELSDAELKLIKAGGGNDDYVTCYANAKKESECQVDQKCYIDFNTHRISGKCVFGRLYEGATTLTCYCLSN